MSRCLLLLILVGCDAGTKGTRPDGGGDAGEISEQDLSASVVEDAGTRDLAGGGGGDLAQPRCPPEMVHVSDRDAGLEFCVDKWEGYVVELTDMGEKPHSPFLVVDGLTLRAKSAAGVYPQAYISQVEAAQACQAAGKRLCSKSEFGEFCRGPDPANYYPYGGEKHIAGYCNEGKGSSVALFFAMPWTYAEFNDPRDNEWDGGLAKTASYPHCVSPLGVWDCVGNLHEWGSDPPDDMGHGKFRGGFYGDAEINGPGCLYVTHLHAPTYHDYSTGFRCCADVE